MNSLPGTPGVSIGAAPGTTDWALVANYESYEEAQRAVDRLSHASCPVETVGLVLGGLAIAANADSAGALLARAEPPVSRA